MAEGTSPLGPAIFDDSDVMLISKSSSQHVTPDATVLAWGFLMGKAGKGSKFPSVMKKKAGFEKACSEEPSCQVPVEAEPTKKKRGRPRTAVQDVDLITVGFVGTGEDHEIIDLCNETSKSRRNYDVGADKEKMDAAIAACNRHAGILGTGVVNISTIAETFHVSRMSLAGRWSDVKGKCDKDVSDLAGDIVVSRVRPQFLPASVETNLSIFVHFMAGCNLPLDHAQIKSRALLMARDLDLKFFKASDRGNLFY